MRRFLFVAALIAPTVAADAQQVVATRPRSELNVDSITGFRINHSLNIHVAGLTVAQAK